MASKVILNLTLEGVGTQPVMLLVRTPGRHKIHLQRRLPSGPLAAGLQRIGSREGQQGMEPSEGSLIPE